MHVAVYLPLLAAAALGWVAPHLAGRLPPETATRLLAWAGVLVSVATSFVLAVLAFMLVAELPFVGRLGSWSTSALDATNPVSDVTSGAAVLAVFALAVVAVRVGVRRARAGLAARRLCGALGGGPGDLVVVDDPSVDVFAVPALRGRIVASRALLASLPPDERRAVLEHEAAHLRHHHHRYRLAAELAAAVNPLIRPLVPAMHYATERWADEAAAGTVGDRAVVARALARTGLRSVDRRPAPWSAAALHAVAGSSSVVRRVEALLVPAPRPRPQLVAVVVAVLAVTFAATAETQRDSEMLLEHAGTTAAAHASVTHAEQLATRATGAW
jgi:hypothetical protein